DLFLLAAAVGQQDVARVAEGEYRLEPRRDVIGEDRDRTGRRDRGEQRVADAVIVDRLAQILVELADRLTGEISLLIKGREGALLSRALHGAEIGGTLPRLHPLLGQLDGARRAVADAAEDQRIGEAGNAEADTSFSSRFLRLRF